MYRDDLIRAAMAAQKLTQADVARKARLNSNTVSAICRGKVEIELTSLIKVAKAIKLDMQDLFESKSSHQ